MHLCTHLAVLHWNLAIGLKSNYKWIIGNMSLAFVPGCYKWRSSNCLKFINCCFILLSDFAIMKVLGKILQASRDYKISLKLVSCKSNKKGNKIPLVLMHCWVGQIEPIVIFSGLLNSPGRTWGDRWSTENTLCTSSSRIQVIS